MDKREFMEAVLLKDIISESNRKYTRDDTFAQMVESVREYGILEPPIVRRLEGGLYRVVAGRRRIAAAREAGLEEVDCVIREGDDPVDDEEIALIENVNRLDMHPLDEAAIFRRMYNGGAPVEEIAKYYARGSGAIYARLRLSFLIEDLKGLFRDGKIGISGAALLAELPEADQEKFYKKSAEYEVEIPFYVIRSFFQGTKHHPVRKILGYECDTCGKRTHNTVNMLFEEYRHLADVCLDGECYGRKWLKKIGEAVWRAEELSGGLATEKKIYFGDGGLQNLYRLASRINLDGEEYEVLKEKEYEVSREKTGREKNCCWRVDVERDGDTERVRVTRAAYEKKKEDAGNGSAAPAKKAYESYGKETLEAAAAAHGETPEKLAEELGAAGFRDYQFRDRVEERLYNRVVSRNIEEKAKRNYARIYFTMVYAEVDGKTGAVEKAFSGDEDRAHFEKIFGASSVDDLEIPEETQKLFHFLLLSESDFYSKLSENIPDPEDLKNSAWEPFLEYAGMNKDEYRKLYRETAEEVIREALEQKKGETGKGGAKKGKEAVSAGAEGDAS